MKRFAARSECPLGPVFLVSMGGSLAGLYFEGQRHFPRDAAEWSWETELPIFAETLRQLAEYFAGKRQSFELPMEPEGTPFQRDVWKELEAIPHGATLTYSELAQRVGRPKAARAVGAAVGRNPLSILIPCHRVVGQNGSLTGYAGGLDRKSALLELEARALR